jgi:SPP1 family predicted phage head-tail adaptor
MKAGELRHRVVLQSPISVRDDAGQTQNSDWNEEATLWAKVEPFSGREYQDDAQVVGENQLRVTLRWPLNAAVNSGWRVVFGSRVLHIDSVTNIDERNRTAVLACREIVS